MASEIEQLIAELEKTAKAAGGAEWDAQCIDVAQEDESIVDFIYAANPANILTLIHELRVMQRALEMAAGDVDGYRLLIRHTPEDDATSMGGYINSARTELTPPPAVKEQ